MSKLYLTHCSAKKFKVTEATFPEKYYAATYLQRFIERCKKQRVSWAILSDRYGIVYPHNAIQPYDLHPSKAKIEELFVLVMTHISVNELVFYHNPNRIHPLYKELLQRIEQNGVTVTWITHLSDIEVR